MEMNYKKLSWCSFEHEKSKQRCEESKYKIHTRQSPLKGAYARKAHTAKKVNGWSMQVNMQINNDHFVCLLNNTKKVLITRSCV